MNLIIGLLIYLGVGLANIAALALLLLAIGLTFSDESESVIHQAVSSAFIIAGIAMAFSFFGLMWYAAMW